MVENSRPTSSKTSISDVAIDSPFRKILYDFAPAAFSQFKVILFLLTEPKTFLGASVNRLLHNGSLSIPDKPNLPKAITL